MSSNQMEANLHPLCSRQSLVFKGPMDMHCSALLYRSLSSIVPINGTPISLTLLNQVSHV